MRGSIACSNLFSLIPPLTIRVLRIHKLPPLTLHTSLLTLRNLLTPLYHIDNTSSPHLHTNPVQRSNMAPSNTEIVSSTTSTTAGWKSSATKQTGSRPSGPEQLLQQHIINQRNSILQSIGSNEMTTSGIPLKDLASSILQNISGTCLLIHFLVTLIKLYMKPQTF